MATVEELKEQIFNTIASLRNSKKQPNEDTIYLSLRQLCHWIKRNKPVNSKKLKVK